jgi:hypothetical protein
LGIERRLLNRPARPVTISTELPRFPPIQNVKKSKFLSTPLRHAGGSRGIAPRILNSPADGAELSTLRSGRFNPGKEPLYPPNRRLGGPRRRSGNFGKEKKNPLDPTETQTPDLPVRSTVTVLTAVYRLLTTGVTQAVSTRVILRTVYSAGVLQTKQKNRVSWPQHTSELHTQQKNGLSSHLTKNTQSMSLTNNNR